MLRKRTKECWKKESEEDIQDNTNAEDQKRKTEVNEDGLKKHSEE